MSTTENGGMGKNMDLVAIPSRMLTITRVSLWMATVLERVDTPGQMEAFMKESGSETR